MKKTLLCLLFLFTNFFYAQVSDIEHCSGDTSFNLTSQKTLLIGNLNPAETNVSYHLSLADAQNNENAIANPNNYVSNVASKTIYARIDNLGTVTTNYFNLIVAPYLTSVASIESISCQNGKGTITVQGVGGKDPYVYSINGGIYSASNVYPDLVPGIYLISTKDALGCITSLHVAVESYIPLEATYVITNVSCYGNNDGSIGITPMGGVSPYRHTLKNSSGIELIKSQQTNQFVNLVAGLYEVEVMDANGCYVNYIVSINEPTFLSATATVENQTITMNATGGNGTYDYSLDGFPYQVSNIFTNVSFGDHEVIIRDQNGCTILMSITVVNPGPPLINGKNAINFEFTPGQTLGDIIVDGQNIKWYSSPNSISGKTSKSAETTLPLTTVLVDGVTYYASQTINGAESTQRLAVTAKSNGSLSNPDFVLPNFKFYPNPIRNNLSINNTAVIDEIEIFSLSGKSVLAKTINNLHAEIDLSGVSTGIYFLKVKSEGVIKSIKILKE